MGSTIRRTAVGLVMCMGLSACEFTAPVQGFSLFSPDAVRRVSVLDGWGQVRAPRGYCVSPQASKPEDGFVTLAPCTVVAGTGNPPKLEGLITIQVGHPASAIVTGREDAMLAYLQTEEGLEVIANRSGLSAIGGQVNDNVVEVLLEQGLSTNISGVNDHEWRAFFDRQDRLVTIAVRPFANRPISDSEALELLRTATSRVQG